MTPKTTHELAVETARKTVAELIGLGALKSLEFAACAKLRLVALIESALAEQRERDAKVCDAELEQYREAKAHLAACGAATCAAAIREGE